MRNKTSHDLMTFLFGTSQEESHQESIVEAAEEIFSQMGQQERLEPKKSPLSAALKKLGIKVESGLDVDPDGFCLSTEDVESYREAKKSLSTADAMHKLAELGWVVADCGDEAMTGEKPTFKIRFIEIVTPESDDKDAKVDLEKIAKDAYDFVNEPVVDEPENPKIPKGGVGKAKPGDKAKHAIAKGKTTVESLVNRLID